MTTDADPGGSDEPLVGFDPAGDLLDVVRRRAPEWLTGRIVDAAGRHGSGVDPAEPELQRLVEDTVRGLLDDLEHLLRTDVDAQRSNPLAVFRAAVAGPNRWLVERGARPPTSAGVDPFGADRFPEDVFELGPATWSDVHPDLHDPGIAWGAWKAMTVLRRRRDEGQR